MARLSRTGTEPVRHLAGTCPGRRASDRSPDEQAVELITSRRGRNALLAGTGRGPFLGLVSAADGADAVAACGWSSEGGGWECTAVLRTWQRRFGARLCALGSSTLSLTVAWPPRTAEHATHVAAEHYAFCPDLAQDYDFKDYASWLVGATVWSLWWD